jgi:hypothetical protein
MLVAITTKSAKDTKTGWQMNWVQRATGIARENIELWMQSSIFLRALRVLRGAILRLF